MLYTNDRELVATWDRKYLENMYVRAAMAFIEEREARDATRIRVVEPDVEPVIEAAVEAMAETPLMHSADVIANYEDFNWEGDGVFRFGIHAGLLRLDVFGEVGFELGFHIGCGGV